MSDNEKNTAAAAGFEPAPPPPEAVTDAAPEAASDAVEQAQDLMAQSASTPPAATPEPSAADEAAQEPEAVDVQEDVDIETQLADASDDMQLSPGSLKGLPRKKRPDIAAMEALDEQDEDEDDMQDTLSVGLSQEVQDHLDALSSVVLDSADVAARSATVATGLANELRATTVVVGASLTKSTLHSKIVLGVTGGMLLLAMGVFFAMAASLQSRIGQVDDMLLAVGKRVVDLNAGIEGINAMNRSLATLGESTEKLMASQAQLEARVQAALGESNALVSNLPKEAAKSIQEGSVALVKQVGALDGQLKKQAGAIQSLGKEVSALKGVVGDVDPLKRDVQALITLQKQRYLEALQQQNSATARDQALTYPRAMPQVKGAPPAASAAPAPAQ
jgi:hypothetical protein